MTSSDDTKPQEWPPTELLEEWASVAYQFLRGQRVNQQLIAGFDLCDMISEVLQRLAAAWRKRENDEATQNLTHAYVRTVAINCLRSCYRKQKKQPARIELKPDIAQVHDDLLDSLETQERKELIALLDLLKEAPMQQHALEAKITLVGHSTADQVNWLCRRYPNEGWTAEKLHRDASEAYKKIRQRENWRDYLGLIAIATVGGIGASAAEASAESTDSRTVANEESVESHLDSTGPTEDVLSEDPWGGEVPDSHDYSSGPENDDNEGGAAKSSAMNANAFPVSVNALDDREPSQNHSCDDADLSANTSSVSEILEGLAFDLEEIDNRIDDSIGDKGFISGLICALLCVPALRSISSYRKGCTFRKFSQRFFLIEGPIRFAFFVLMLMVIERLSKLLAQWGISGWYSLLVFPIVGVPVLAVAIICWRRRGESWRNINIKIANCIPDQSRLSSTVLSALFFVPFLFLLFSVLWLVFFNHIPGGGFNLLAAIAGILVGLYFLRNRWKNLQEEENLVKSSLALLQNTREELASMVTNRQAMSQPSDREGPDDAARLDQLRRLAAVIQENLMYHGVTFKKHVSSKAIKSNQDERINNRRN